jgi:hypothetical protein
VETELMLNFVGESSPPLALLTKMNPEVLMMSAMIQMFIASAYDGGAEKFAQDYHLFISEGEAVFAPQHDGSTLSDKFKNKFNEMCEGFGLKAVYAARCNFEGYGHEEAAEMLNEQLREALGDVSMELRISVDPALFDAQAPNTELDSEDGEFLIEALSSLTNIENLRIKFQDDVFFKIPLEGSAPAEDSKKEPKRFVALATGRPDRDTIISQDDHINLKIALGQCDSVDEFLAMI